MHAGHGENNPQNCAEFCPTSHHFTVNGREYAVSFDTAGTPWGCANEVLAGSVPNEHGAPCYRRRGVLESNLHRYMVLRARWVVRV